MNHLLIFSTPRSTWMRFMSLRLDRELPIPRIDSSSRLRGTLLGAIVSAVCEHSWSVVVLVACWHGSVVVSTCTWWLQRQNFIPLPRECFLNWFLLVDRRFSYLLMLRKQNCLSRSLQTQRFMSWYYPLLHLWGFWSLNLIAYQELFRPNAWCLDIFPFTCGGFWIRIVYQGLQTVAVCLHNMTLSSTRVLYLWKLPRQNSLSETDHALLVFMSSVFYHCWPAVDVGNRTSTNEPSRKASWLITSAAGCRDYWAVIANCSNLSQIWRPEEFTRALWMPLRFCHL